MQTRREFAVQNAQTYLLILKISLLKHSESVQCSGNWGDAQHSVCK